MKLTARDEQLYKLGPGLYEVERLIKIDGQPFTSKVTCANPAYATRILDKWQADTIAFIERKATKAA